MSVDRLTSSDTWTLEFVEPAEVVGGVVLVRPENLAPPVEPPTTDTVINVSVVPGADLSTALGYMETQIQTVEGVAAQEYLNVTFLDITASGTSFFVPAPVSGTYSVGLVCASAIPSADLVFSTSISGAPVTGGSLTIPSGSAAGFCRGQGTSGSNTVVTRVNAVQVTLTTTNVTAGSAVFVLGFTRS